LGQYLLDRPPAVLWGTYTRGPGSSHRSPRENALVYSPCEVRQDV